MSGLQLRHKAASEDGMNKATYMQLSGTWHLHDNTYKGMGFCCHRTLVSRNTTHPRCHETKIRLGAHIPVSALLKSWHLRYIGVAIVAACRAAKKHFNKKAKKEEDK